MSRRLALAVLTGAMIATGCTAQDLATAASVAAGVLADGPATGASAAPGSGPLALPSGGPFSRPSTAPIPRASGGPIVAPGGAPIALPGGGAITLPSLPTSPGAHRWTPKWTLTTFVGEPSVEALVFKYTNEARVAEGLPPFVHNARLDVASRQHSQEMIEEDYFDHTSPHAELARPSQRAAMAGYKAGCGENIYDFTPDDDPEALARGLVDGWMKSPGHRANILGEYEELGVGIHRGRGRLMATQLFGSGETFDFTDVTIEDAGATYRLVVRGKAAPWTTYRSVKVTLDDDVQGGALTFAPGGAIAFEVQVPKGGLHEVGANQYDPADEGGQYWPTTWFKLDTSKPVAQAIL